ncbi:MAG TPA: DoxX family protein [Burkholderiales bacterium]|nr:DoxX family protein [Burkholderiales bacterium]
MSEDTGKLILRLTLGVFILLHGYAKIVNGVGGIGTSLTNAGLPAWVSYGVYIGEVLAPLLVILGFYARVGGAIIVINMIFAIALSHSKQLFELSKSGGWALELQGFFLLAALVIVLIGPGRFSINRR